MYCVKLPLVIVISYFVLRAIIRVISSSGSQLDQIICYGALICFVIIMLLGAWDMIRGNLKAAAKRQEWKNACISAELTIINRYEGGSYDDGDHFHTVSASLELEMNSDQRAVSPNLTSVKISVSDYIFTRLKKLNTVRIYYMPQSPLTFLLEDEL